MRGTRKLTIALLVLAAATALVACGGSDESTTAAEADESAAVTGKFEPLADAAPGYAKVAGEAELQRADGGTTVSIEVKGLEPKTAYIAHLHAAGCDQAEPGGPHFRFEKGGSEEPPNEIHLKFTSDANGKGKAEATSRREVPVGEAGSVVLHVDDDGSHHEMAAYESGAPEAATAVFVHEGESHDGEGGRSEPAPSDKIACAELEGTSTGEGEAPTASSKVPTVVVRDGEPVGGIQELEFSAGEEVRFRVSSDQEEEIHVHGYDISKVVPAGGVVEFDFPAELEGIYEAELEELGVQIIELRINP